MCGRFIGYPDPVCFVRVTSMALYRIKPGFNPETASLPSWNAAEMDYLLDSVFEVEEGRTWNNYLVTIDADGHYWYLNPDWVVPVVPNLNLTVVGDEI